jgi:putative DNA primase/helicase
MSSPSSSSDDATLDVPAEGEGSVAVLLRLAAGAQAFRSADGHFYARVPVGDRHEVHGLKSAALRDWLIDGYLVDQGELPTDWTIRRVLNALEARARVKGGTSSVFIRVGRNPADDDDSSSYLDLGDPSGRAVQIGAEGWSVVNRPCVPFRRPQGLLPLPRPSRDGSIEPLRSSVTSPHRISAC